MNIFYFIIKQETMKQLALENQICFPFYAISRIITKAYKPFLDKIWLTYPQYLVFLVLWEKDKVPVKYLSEKLILETNTLTPLLKRLEAMKLLKRLHNSEDKRSIIIQLTPKGKALKEKAKNIPINLYKKIENNTLKNEDLQTMKKNLDILIWILQEKEL